MRHLVEDLHCNIHRCVLVQHQEASAQQLPAGTFYRELLNAGSPETFGQVQTGNQQVVASAPTKPASRHVSIYAADAQPRGEQPAADQQMPDGAAVVAESEYADARAGLGSTQRIEIRRPVSSREPTGLGTAAGAAFVGPSLDYGIPSDNVGFQLLRKAGWQPGAGLGAESQGRRMPLEQSQQKGRQGLGAPTAKPVQMQPQVKQPQQNEQQADAKQVCGHP